MNFLKKIIGKALDQARDAFVLPADVSMDFCKTCQRGEQLACLLTLKSQESAIDVEKISVALIAEESVEVDAGYKSGSVSLADYQSRVVSEADYQSGVVSEADYQSGWVPEAEDVEVTIYVGTVTNTAITVNEVITVGNGINLEPNSEHSWKVNIVVPKDSNATYRGVNAHHIWHLSATITLANRKLLSKKNFSYKWDGLIIL